MLRSVVDVGIAFVDLLAAQARDLTDGVERAGSRIALLVGFALAGAVLFLAGAGLMVWALFMVLDQELSRPQAALLTGAIVWLVTALLGWAVLSSTRRRAER